MDNEPCKKCGLKPVYLQVTGYDKEGKCMRCYVTDIDACIAPIVKALNDTGIPTSECCCGHGDTDPVIFLQDGRTITIEGPLKRCLTCHKQAEYPHGICEHCGSEQLEPSEVT